MFYTNESKMNTALLIIGVILSININIQTAQACFECGVGGNALVRLDYLKNIAITCSKQGNDKYARYIKDLLGEATDPNANKPAQKLHCPRPDFLENYVRDTLMFFPYLKNYADDIKISRT